MFGWSVGAVGEGSLGGLEGRFGWSVDAVDESGFEERALMAGGDSADGRAPLTRDRMAGGGWGIGVVDEVEEVRGGDGERGMRMRRKKKEAEMGKGAKE